MRRVIKLVPLQILDTGLPFLSNIGPVSALASTEKFTILFEYNLTHRDGTAPADTQARCFNILFHCYTREILYQGNIIFQIVSYYTKNSWPYGCEAQWLIMYHYRIIRPGVFNRSCIVYCSMIKS